MWQPEQPSSHIVASRGFLMSGCLASRRGRVTARLRLVISSTAWPFSTSAPVGQTCTHLPQLVQDRASPQGRSSSATSIELMPRAEMSQTCAPSISSHTRTQREHRMQRLWSSTKRGCDMSTGRRGIIVREA